jgi:hypothetical protein
VPERIDASPRDARGGGRRPPHRRARNAYFAAVSALEKPPPAEAVHREPPKALEITARREAPGEESAVIMYERWPSEPITRALPETQPVKPAKPVKSAKPKAKKRVTAQP